MITADPPEHGRGDDTVWRFRLIDGGDGWHLTLEGKGHRSSYVVRFYRVRPNPKYRAYPDREYDEYRELVWAKMLRPGVVRIPDAKLAKLTFEDNVALNGLLHALAEHEPLRPYRGWPRPER